MEFYSGIKDSGNVAYTREEVFSILESMGVSKATVSFSGGHDEGGSDQIVLQKFEEKVEIQEHIFPYEVDEDDNMLYDEEEIDLSGGGTRTVRRPRERELTQEEKDEMKLAQALSAPVYDQYSSFAGEFSVSGDVVWEAEGRNVSMDGQESVESYQDIGKEL